MISIATTTYNGERFLEELLRSLIEQTTLPNELVVCDDGLTDRTPEILAQFAKRASFPVRIVIKLRVSTRGIAQILKKRVEQSQMPRRRMMWPNDESFVATELVRMGFKCRDFNEIQKLYDEKSFSYYDLLNSDHITLDGKDPFLFHRVLCGRDYSAKMERSKIDNVCPSSLFRRAEIKIRKRFEKW
jgi:hypothetical protein